MAMCSLTAAKLNCFLVICPAKLIPYRNGLSCSQSLTHRDIQSFTHTDKFDKWQWSFFNSYVTLSKNMCVCVPVSVCYATVLAVVVW